MKLNLDCIREILLQMEEIPYNGFLEIESLHAALSTYSEDEIMYSVQKLIEADFITAVTTKGWGETYINGVKDITFEGHQFLANIREDNNWKQIKSISSNIVFAGLKIITAISEGVATAAINKYLGFSN